VDATTIFVVVLFREFDVEASIVVVSQTWILLEYLKTLMNV
jgi:hypothetical protein